MTYLVALLPTFPLMEQVTKRCVVEQEDIRREKLIALMHITLKVKQQLMATMLMAY